MNPLRRIAACAALALLATSTFADNWPGWRGPTGNGLCTEQGLATEWSPTQNVAWKLPLPGPAGATPVVWGERVFLTSVNDAGELLLIAVSTDGKQLWQQVVASGNQKARGDEGNSASPSPVTDGKSVWTFMGDGTLAVIRTDNAGGLGSAFSYEIAWREGQPGGTVRRSGKFVSAKTARGAAQWEAERLEKLLA